jgi:hypothetical protein
MDEPGLHNGEEELAGVVLELQDKIHPGLAQRVDVVQDQGRDDPQPVRLVGCYASLKQKVQIRHKQKLLFIIFGKAGLYRKFVTKSFEEN